MIEQAMRSALLLLAGMLLSAGALGQTVTLTQDNDYMVTLAAEYFGGSAREVTFVGNSQASVRLDFADDASVTGAGQLDPNNERSITFTLNGATFAASATPSNLRFYLDGAEAGNIARTVTDGGARGDRSVTYLLEVVSTFTPAGGNDFLWFTLPNLDVTTVNLGTAAVPAPGVTVVASLGRDGQTGSNPFPEAVLGTGLPGQPGVVNPIADGQVIALARSFTASLGQTAQYTADVALTNRKAITAGTGMEVTLADGTTKRRGLQVGELSIGLSAAGTNQTRIRVLRTGNVAMGGTPAISGGALDASLGGTAVVTVSGPFQEGDLVLLGADQTDDAAKAFTGSGGSRTASVQLGAVAAQGVFYVPGGVADLTPGVFSASLALNFNDARNANGPVRGAQSSGRLGYRGTVTRAYAYGVVRGTGIERSFLRVGCRGAPAATGECSVFLSCAGQDGTPYFGELDKVPNNQTAVFDSVAIAGALDGGWSNGRGRCDLLSDGMNLDVQHMVRSGGIQVNNSVVIGDNGILDRTP